MTYSLKNMAPLKILIQAKESSLHLNSRALCVFAVLSVTQTTQNGLTLTQPQCQVKRLCFSCPSSKCHCNSCKRSIQLYSFVFLMHGSVSCTQPGSFLSFENVIVRALCPPQSDMRDLSPGLLGLTAKHNDTHTTRSR